MHRFELSPNASLTESAALVFFGLVAGVSLSVAGLFVAQGYWPVLPFAGAELALLGWALWRTLARSRDREWITLDDGRVVLERRHGRAHERIELKRPWTRAVLEAPRYRNHASRLVLTAHGRRYEIGRFLTEAERTALARRLSELLPMV
jgi:uncharacterized membrane protein